MSNKVDKKIRRHARALVAGGLYWNVFEAGNEDAVGQHYPSEEELVREIRRRVSNGMYKVEDIPTYNDEEDEDE